MDFALLQNPPAAGLQGLLILIVEDNPYIAIALEDLLSEQGRAIAGVAGALDDALLLAASASLDIALLDVNLGDRKIDPVAEALMARGKPSRFHHGLRPGGTAGGLPGSSHCREAVLYRGNSRNSEKYAIFVNAS